MLARQFLVTGLAHVLVVHCCDMHGEDPITQPNSCSSLCLEWSPCKRPALPSACFVGHLQAWCQAQASRKDLSQLMLPMGCGDCHCWVLGQHRVNQAQQLSQAFPRQLVIPFSCEDSRPGQWCSFCSMVTQDSLSCASTIICAEEGGKGERV